MSFAALSSFSIADKRSDNRPDAILRRCGEEQRAPVYHRAVTDDDLAQARRDPAFRKQLLANNLDYLLGALARLRASE